eukprot:COSAG06_NODE_7776_length_2378_cov_88.745064_2_plen_147_part_00
MTAHGRRLLPPIQGACRAREPQHVSHSTQALEQGQHNEADPSSGGGSSAGASMGIVLYWRVTEKTVASRLPAALAYKLIRRGCSPADLATLAMLWPRGGHVPQQTKAGRAIKPGQGASNLAPPLQPLPGASPPAGGDQAAQQETAC